MSNAFDEAKKEVEANRAAFGDDGGPVFVNDPNVVGSGVILSNAGTDVPGYTNPILRGIADAGSSVAQGFDSVVSSAFGDDSPPANPAGSPPPVPQVPPAAAPAAPAVPAAPVPVDKVPHGAIVLPLGGAGIGFLVGGPIGAVVGGLIGFFIHAKQEQ